MTINEVLKIISIFKTNKNWWTEEYTEPHYHLIYSFEYCIFAEQLTLVLSTKKVIILNLGILQNRKELMTYNFYMRLISKSVKTVFFCICHINTKCMGERKISLDIFLDLSEYLAAWTIKFCWTNLKDMTSKDQLFGGSYIENKKLLFRSGVSFFLRKSASYGYSPRQYNEFLNDCWLYIILAISLTILLDNIQSFNCMSNANSNNKN